MARHNHYAILVAFLLLASVIASVSMVAPIKQTSAQVPNIFTSPKDGQIFSFANGTQNPINVEVSTGGIIGWSKLPDNAIFDSSSPTDGKIVIDETTPDGVYGVTLTASDDGTANGQISTVDIIIVNDVIQLPVITLDRAEYLRYDIATITVNDITADNNLEYDDEIQVDVTSTGSNASAMTTITLSEVIGGPHGMFTADIQLVPFGSSPSMWFIEVEVGSNITATLTNSAGTGEATAQIVSHRIEFDRSKYNVDSMPLIEAIDERANDPNIADTIQVTVESLSDDVIIDLLETGADTGIFLGCVELTGSSMGSTSPPPPPMFSGCDDLAASYNDLITVTHSGRNDTADVVQPFIEFDRDVYTPYIHATLRLVHPDLNSDPKAREYATVTVKSDDDASGIGIVLVETGPDTAEFNSTTYLRFTEEATSNQAATALRALDGSQAYATTGSDECTVPCGAGITSDSVDIVEGGAGSEDLGNPTPADPFGSFSAHTCADHGGDVDKDGICDNWEWPVSSVLTIPYSSSMFTYTKPSYDAYVPSKSYKDLFVEIDWLHNTANGKDFEPLQQGLSNVVSVFANAPFIYPPENKKGIRLHYLLNEEVTVNNEFMGMWSGTSATEPYSYTQIKQSNFGASAAERSNINILYARMQVWHYALFADKQGFDPASSGLGEVVGNDFVVTLGDFDNIQVEQQNTFMHELGHNLGLHHGGGLISPYFDAEGNPMWVSGFNVNCKPNYPSLMTYSRQMPSLDMPNPPLDYSRYMLYPAQVAVPGGSPRAGTSSDPLDMNSLYESGLKGASSTPLGILWGVRESDGSISVEYKDITSTNFWIDWNGNDVQDSGIVTADVRNLNIPGCHETNLNDPNNPNANLLKGYKDWSKDSLILDHRKYNALTFASGMNSDPEILDEPSSQIVGEIRDLALEALQDEVGILDPDARQKLLELIDLEIGEDSLMTFVLTDDFEGALGKLFEIRALVDGSAGGNPRDDVQGSAEAKEGIIELVDANIEYYKAVIEFPTRAQSFSMKNEEYATASEISLRSVSVANAGDSFVITEGESIEFDLDGQGYVELVIPTTVIDPEMEGSGAMQVMADGEPVPFQATESAEGMMLQFVYPEGAESVVIMDTRVIPEFTVTALLLALSLLAIIALTAFLARSGRMSPSTSLFKG